MLRAEPMPPWFAIRTHARAEKVVRDYLQRKDLDVFLPTVTRWSRWKDRKKAIEWPLFPGYCFARFGPADDRVVLPRFHHSRNRVNASRPLPARMLA